MKDNIKTETGLYFPSDSAEDTICRLDGQVRQLYYLHRDMEEGIPVDRERLGTIVESILYITLHAEEYITNNSIPGKTENMKMETRGNAMKYYSELKKNVEQYYNDLRSYARKRIAKNQF